MNYLNHTIISKGVQSLHHNTTPSLISMSSNQEWSQDILKQLNLRDSRENHEIDARYFNAFQQLSQKLNQLSQQQILFYRTNQAIQKL